MSIHSYLPQERAATAQAQLTEAGIAVERATFAWKACADPDEKRTLLDAVHGAQAEVGNWERYVKAGCPRVRGTE